MNDVREPLTIRESALLTLIGVPLTVGLAYFLGYLEGVDKFGWVWWPALLSFLFSALAAISGVVSLVGYFIRPTVKRLGGALKRPVEQMFEWAGKLIAFAVITSVVVWMGIEFFDALDRFSRIDIIAFVFGGLIVYLVLNRN